MKILERSVYRGPHLFSARPMVRLMVDLGPLEERPTNTLPGFTEALLAQLPGLASHGCSYRQEGGLVRRMNDGTWLGHVVEHLALELQTLAGSPVSRGKTRSVKGQPGVYNVLYAYRDEALGLEAGEAAIRLVQSLLPEELREPGAAPFDLAAELASLTALQRKGAFGPTTAALVAEARRRGIPVTRLNEQSLVRLGWGARQKLIRASVTQDTSLIAAETAGDKALTKSLLTGAGVPSPRGVVVRTADEALSETKRLKRPLVAKPLDGNHGRGVSLDLSTPEQIAWGFEQASKHSRRVIIEEQFVGKDYRALVVGGRLVAVAERTPAQVVGNGRNSIRRLIETVNADPRRGVGHECVMTRIRIDDHVRERLARLGMDERSVPEAGQVVQLRATANLSTGGEAIDRTDEIHPDNAAICRRAALVVGLDIAGIDLVLPDITRSAHETGGGVVEVNAAPGFRMHLEPSTGKGRDVAKPVIANLFPPGARSRIPICAITGTNGKSTTVRMVSHILSRSGLTVGFTTTSGVYVGREQIYKGDASGPKSARMILADPTVDVAVLETARGGILREGLGFDRSDVGCVLNVAPDHLGIKGVNTLEDLAAVKSIVTESVSRRGLSILNADDPLTIRMARHAGGRIAFFTLNGGPDLSPLMQKHIALGGMAAALEPSIEGGDLVFYDRGERTLVTSARAVPATIEGKARFNIANALAAVLIARRLGLGLPEIAAALADFHSSFEDNPGRINIHDRHGIKVIVDYAHNPAGLTALGELIQALKSQHDCVIGCVSIPGDRRDEDIAAMGALATDLFDHIVFREKPDGRGRPPGDVLKRLREGAVEAGHPLERVECIPGETAAIAACLERARPGDLVVLLPTDVEAAWRQVKAFEPVRAAGARPQEALHA